VLAAQVAGKLGVILVQPLVLILFLTLLVLDHLQVVLLLRAVV
jgi:hypothetical protein